MVQHDQVSKRQGPGLFCAKEHPFLGYILAELVMLAEALHCVSCQLTETEPTFPYRFEQFH